DPRWELIDPNPNIHALFQQFNKLYFWRALDMVEVRWSARMTLCAGICSYQGRGGLCSIGLSQPLLKLRPRKDLIETLLHEMIHAYLFVTANNRDRDGHGPEFCKHMNRINAETGTNITIYHSFHDEVDELRQHWWRCRGACQRRPPYFGFVKRSMNRAPSKNDTWWAEHQRTCGGSYDKVKEPENYGKKKISGNNIFSITNSTQQSQSAKQCLCSSKILKYFEQKNIFISSESSEETNNNADSANNNADSANNNADSANNHDDLANNTDDDDGLPPFNYPSNSRLSCPICLLLVDAPQINSHVDLCLN
uniref:DNA-dependent metalloprotease SPRTN n=1 Tax=Ciona savignyi TaxID=51511 RepID=H2YD65_CIOSA